MPDCQCNNLERRFDTRVAEDDLRDYLARGADGTTQQLVDRLLATGVDGRTVLDIGGGIGAIQLELLAAGAASTLDIDASQAYLDVARREAVARGYGERTQYRHGDFVGLADDVGPADVVTLDRVICCYPDLDALAWKAAERARERLALVHPHDRWWTRIGVRAMNGAARLFRQPRFYVHRTARLETILQSAGLEREWAGGTWFWRVAVYRRTRAAAG